MPAILKAQDSQIHSITVDYSSNTLYAQGWKGYINIIDISIIEQAYEEDKTTAFQKIRKISMNSSQDQFLYDCFAIQVGNNSDYEKPH